MRMTEEKHGMNIQNTSIALVCSHPSSWSGPPASSIKIGTCTCMEEVIWFKSFLSY